MDHRDIQAGLATLREQFVQRGYEKPDLRFIISDAGSFERLGDFDIVALGGGLASFSTYAHSPTEAFAAAEAKLGAVPRRWTMAEVAATLGIEPRAA